ncbi:putative DNA-binding domain protein [Vibrio phage 142E35-1]|nr:putative DNA-binding domain protein [Vibrio phage 142E35-1]
MGVSIMTVTDFKVWLAKNDHTQKSLAAALKMHENTISGYVRNERFPFVFVLALATLEQGN